MIEDGIFTPTEEEPPRRRDQPADDERDSMGWKRPQESVPNLRPPCRGHDPALRSWSNTLMTWSSVLTPGNRPSRSRPRLPNGWHPGVLSSTRTRPDRAPVQGFDFLEVNVRRYRNGKLLITPSPAAVKRFRKRGSRTRCARCAARTRRQSSPHSPRSSGVGCLLPSGVQQDLR